MVHVFETRDSASLAAASCIATALKERLDSSNTTSFVVTGGSSPRACYSTLATTELPWDRVHLLLSDERWVPPTHDESNEKMIRERLLIGNAAKAQMHPFYAVNTTAEARCAALTDELRKLPRPFAVCLLGMGDDGHIASLFADAENFAEDIDINNEQLCVPIITSASPHTRVSLSLSALLQSDEIVLLFFGDRKQAVYEQAKRDAVAFPVSRILHQDDVPVSVFWAP